MTDPSVPEPLPVTAKGRGLPIVKAWLALLIVAALFHLLSRLGPAPFNTLQTLLHLSSAGLAAYTLNALNTRSRTSTTAAGLSILTTAALLAHGHWTNPRPPGGEAFFTLIVMAKSTLLVVPLAVYLYLDRLRRHGYLT